jgi:NADPH:quinone reductase-like Zn-dependent oxidoreductase
VNMPPLLASFGYRVADLSELAGFVERGDVKPRMGEVFRLEQAREAQDASLEGRGNCKILLEVA